MGAPRITQSDPSHAVVTFESELVSSTVTYLRPALRTLLDGGVNHMVIDLAHCEMIDSSGIGMLLGVHLRLLKTEGTLEILNASDNVLDLFHTLRVVERIKVTGREG